MANFIIGHRGAKAYTAENTIESVITAVQLGALWVEFDIKLSADNELVVIHDDDVFRTTGGVGKVKDLSLKELKELNANYLDDKLIMEIPTLNEMIKCLFHHKLGANIEIKPNEDQADKTGKSLALWMNNHWPKGLRKPIISSFDFKSLNIFNKFIHHDVEIALLYDDPLPSHYSDEIKKYKASSIHLNQKYVTKELTLELKKQNLPLRSYTVNDKETALRFKRWGVQSIFTDHPDLLL